MYKVININIGGRVFQIEETAFDTLSDYISSLKKYFAGKPEGTEIVADIEQRIAELLQSKLTGTRTNVTKEDVAEIIGSMGSPKDIAGDESNAEAASEPKEKNTNQQEYSSGKNKIYRDPDGKVIGGVCSGLAYYFDLDSTIMRLIFIALFFAGGSSIFIYLILLIVIPEAKTTAEKLAMRKEKINIDTIRKSVEDEFGKIKGNFEKGNYQGRVSGFFQKIFHVIGLIVAAFFKFVGKFIGFVFAVAAILAFVGLISLTVGSSTMNGQQIGLFNSNYLNFFENTNDRILAMVAIVLCFFAVILIFLNISRSLLSTNAAYANKKYYNRITGTISILAVVLVIISIAKTASYFSFEASIENKIMLDSTIKKIIIKSENNHHRGMSFFVDNDTLNFRDIELKIETTDGKPELIQVIESRGQNYNKAKSNASNCIYNLTIKDSVIIFPEKFTLKNNQPFRKQKIMFVLKLPSGYSFELDRASSMRISGRTVSDYGFHKGRVFEVEKDGIHCLDCNHFNTSHSSDDTDYDYIYPVGNIKKLTVSSALKIRVIKGSQLMVKARGLENQSDLLVEENNGHVEIHLRHSFFNNSNEDVEVLLITPDLNNIALDGAVEAEIEGFDPQKMEISCSGASKCHANISPGFLTLELDGASEIELKGRSTQFVVDAEGASNLDASEFEAQSVVAEASGASNLDLYARQSLKAKSWGASKISYTGHPAVTDCISFGAGKIEIEE